MKIKIINCNCKCPYFGKKHENIWEVQCECGRREVACGFCLVAGRTTMCSRCAKKEPSHSSHDKI